MGLSSDGICLCSPFNTLSDHSCVETGVGEIEFISSSWVDDAGGNHPFDVDAKLSVLPVFVLMLASRCGGDGTIADNSLAGSNKVKKSISISSMCIPPMSIKFQLILSNSVTFVVVAFVAS